MPQIIMCPTRHNDMQVLMGMMKETSVLESVTTAGLMEEFNVLLVRTYLQNRGWRSSWLTHTTGGKYDTSAYESCFSSRRANGPGCKLLRILGCLWKQTEYVGNSKDGITEYIALHAMNQSGMMISEDNFQSWMQSHAGVSLDKCMKRLSRAKGAEFMLFNIRYIMSLYMTFFEVFQLDSEGELESEVLIPPRSLESFSTDDIITLKSSDDFVQFLPWFWEGIMSSSAFDVKRELSDLVQKMYLRALATYLGFKSPERALRLYAAFGGNRLGTTEDNEPCSGAENNNGIQ